MKKLLENLGWIGLAILLAGSCLLWGCGPGAKDRNEIRIGVNAELTGSKPTVGDSCKKAMELLTQQVNQAGGLKVGDRLRVVAPGKEVVNPQTHASLGYTSDTPAGEVKVVELLGTTGAVAQGMSGGPFKPNDKVKARR